MAKWFGGVCVVVVVVGAVACGGTSRNRPSGASDEVGGEAGTGAGTAAGSGGVSGGVAVGSGGASGGVAAGSGGVSGGDAAGNGGAGEGERPPSPMKDGVPIGACRETGETRPAECPAQPPEDQTSCEAPSGLLRCPYEIRVADGRADQVVYTCHPAQLSWGSALVSCGRLCESPDENVIELGGPACEDRATSSCESGSTFAFETQQGAFNAAFEAVIQSCVGDVLGTRFQLWVENGCPTRISSSKPFSEDATQCLRVKLGTLRWDCALDLSCSSYLRALT